MTTVYLSQLTSLAALCAAFQCCTHTLGENVWVTAGRGGDDLPDSELRLIVSGVEALCDFQVTAARARQTQRKRKSLNVNTA